MRLLKRERPTTPRQDTLRVGPAIIAGLLAITLIASAALGKHFLRVQRQQIPNVPGVLLPGEEVWHGWPSLLFGTNETQNWDPQHTFETIPAIQAQLKADHFPFIRTWFFEHSLIDHAPVSDAEQLKRVAAARNAGLTCLAELPTGNSMAYNEHIVQLVGDYCHLFEFMNEPDNEGVSVASYVARWKAEIPRLRTIAPGALFGGPAAAGPAYTDCTAHDDGTQECYLQKVMKGMAASKVLPDFITFHWYPCWQDTATSCQAKASTFGEVSRRVIAWTKEYFGHTIPVGLTEWNADPSTPMPSYATGDEWITQFTTTALRSMQSSGLAFANQFALASYAGYGTFDMVDIAHNGKPKAQYLAMKALIASARSG